MMVTFLRWRLFSCLVVFIFSLCDSQPGQGDPPAGTIGGCDKGSIPVEACAKKCGSDAVRCTLCTVKKHCSDNAKSVTSDGEECNCTCKDGWSGAKCDEEDEKPPATRRRRRRTPTEAPTKAPDRRRRRRTPILTGRRRKLPTVEPEPEEPETTLTTTTLPGCAGTPKDVFIAVDASKSVKGAGWDAQTGFLIKLIQEITAEGNPYKHHLNVHWFNQNTNPIAQSGGANSVGQFGPEGQPIINAIRALDYNNIRSGATDHPQVYETASAAFKSSSARSNTDKILIMITDGETHNGKDCKKHDQSAVDSKIGTCRNNQNHACYPRKCLLEKCLCGLYTAEMFKDEGYTNIIVGIANKNHMGDVETGVFNKIMKTAASDGQAYLAENFEDLDGIVDDVVGDFCRPRKGSGPGVGGPGIKPGFGPGMR